MLKSQKLVGIRASVSASDELAAWRGSTTKRNRRTQFRANMASTLPSEAVQIARASAAVENLAAKMRNLFPFAEESAIFAAGLTASPGAATRPS